MAKRIYDVVIVMLLLIATGGLPITQHYCGPKAVSVSVYSTPKDCCGGHCDKCHNVFRFSKVNDNFEAGISVNSKAPSDFITLHSVTFCNLFAKLTVSLVPTSFDFRAWFISGSDHSPASLGTFRC